MCPRVRKKTDHCASIALWWHWHTHTGSKLWLKDVRGLEGERMTSDILATSSLSVRVGCQEEASMMVCRSLFSGTLGRQLPACGALARVMAAVMEGTLRWWGRTGSVDTSVGTRFVAGQVSGARGSIQGHRCYVVVLHHLRGGGKMPQLRIVCYKKNVNHIELDTVKCG